MNSNSNVFACTHHSCVFGDSPFKKKNQIQESKTSKYNNNTKGIHFYAAISVSPIFYGDFIGIFQKKMTDNNILTL